MCLALVFSDERMEEELEQLEEVLPGVVMLKKEVSILLCNETLLKSWMFNRNFQFPATLRDFINNPFECAVVLKDRNKSYVPRFSLAANGFKIPVIPYLGGINVAEQMLIEHKKVRYYSGFHFSMQLHYVLKESREIQCLVRKKWITAVGMSSYSRDLVYVTDAAFFPSYPRKVACIKDFEHYMSTVTENESRLTVPNKEVQVV